MTTIEDKKKQRAIQYHCDIIKKTELELRYHKRKLKELNVVIEEPEVKEDVKPLDYNSLSENLIENINKMLWLDIRDRKRTEEIVTGRIFYYHYMKKHTDLSLKGISALLINQDHSSLIYSLRMFEDRYLLEKSFREQYDKLINLMES